MLVMDKDTYTMVRHISGCCCVYVTALLEVEKEDSLKSLAVF
jgi:hypothetical protein